MSSSNTYRLSNEQLLLVSFLNNMYNDNIIQINNITRTLNALNATNDTIRNLLVQILHSNSNNPRNNSYNRRTSRHGHTNTNDHLLDTLVEYEYVIPLNNRNNLYSLAEFMNSQNQSNPNPTIESMINDFLQPIHIYPTQMQIENATRRVRFSDIARPINLSCPISLEEFNDSDTVTVIRYCGHIFNSENLSNWFRTNCRCPVCRYDIRTYSGNSRELFPPRTTTRSLDVSGNHVI